MKIGCHVPMLLVFFYLLLSSSGKSSEVCISPGGRFPPFSSEGKSPRKVVKGPRDLTLCRVFRKSTCCDVAQTYPALLTIRKLASTGEASQECLHLWELLECSICDPHVGTQPGPPVICASLCDMVFQACSSAYFSVDAMTQVLTPCGLHNVVCGRASEWASNGTELCRLSGFSVQQAGSSYQGEEELFCYGGKVSLESIADSWAPSRSASPQKAEKSRVLEDFWQRVRKMPVSEKVSWAVGGMVLTAGLWLMSKQKSHSQRHKQAAILRTARRLEAKINQQTSTTQGNRRRIGR